jgi:hypothetical protein
MIFNTIEFLDNSENAPLPIPDQVRLVAPQAA